MVMANGDGGGRTLSSVCTRGRARVHTRTCECVYRDSSLKIQMEYRAFEERSARGGGVRWRMEAGGAQGRARTSMGWGRYFKNRILIRAANPTLCNPYVCVGLTYPLGAPSVCALSLSFFLQLIREPVCHPFTLVCRIRNLKLNRRVSFSSDFIAILCEYNWIDRRIHQFYSFL